MKEGDPCPYCKSEVYRVDRRTRKYRFTCSMCGRHYDENGELVILAETKRLHDHDECPGCGFYTGLVPAGKFKGFQIFNCHQCNRTFYANRRELSEEEIKSLSKKQSQ